MLATALREYDRQQRLSALAVNEAQRIGVRGAQAVARRVRVYQAAAVAVSLESLGPILDEQDISSEADAAVVPAALLTATNDAAAMLDKAQTDEAFLRIVQTLVVDASRTARTVDMATRPAVTGYVRSLRPPSCSRCAILAGHVYRYSQGFQRHPRCDCLMTPTTDAIGPQLVTDPTEAFERGQIRGLSRADIEAVQAGADLGRVVNVRSQAAGLTVGSSVTVRAGRLTPQGCLMFASNREESLRLLRRHGYIR